MPIVNLIQEQRNAVKQREQQVRMLFVGILAVGAISFLTAGFFTFETVRLHVRANALEKKKEELQPKMDQVVANEEALALLQPRLASLESATVSTEKWSSLLGHLTTNTPDGVWLTGVNALPPTNTTGVVIALTGLSMSQEAVGVYILRLEAAPELENVTLKYTQEKTGPEGNWTQYEISAVLAGTAPEKPKATEKTD